MAEPDLAPVVALQLKARALSRDGMWATAAEKFGAAAEAAKQLLRAPDCLVVTNLRVKQAYSLLSHLQSPHISGDDQVTVWARISLELLPECLETLQRRRAAGTLMPGTCRPVEVAYYDQMVRRRAQPLWSGPNGKLHVKMMHAPCVGYAVFVEAAGLTMSVLANAQLETLLRQPAAAAATLAARVEFVTQAMRMLQTPPELGPSSLTAESDFVNAVRKLLDRCCDQLDEAAGQTLARAWREVEASGALRGRCLEDGVARTARELAAADARGEQRAATRGLRTCELEACGAREVEAAQFKKCAACGTVVYCCREHQVTGWPAHRAACKAARKAAATGGDASA